MNTKLKKMIAVISAIVMILSLAACGQSNGSSSGNEGGSAGSGEGGTSSGNEIQSVSIYMPSSYDNPDAQMVNDAINAITESKYQIHLELNLIPFGNWAQTVNLLFTGDDGDIACLMGTPLSTYVKNGQLVDLTEYWANASDAFHEVWSDEEMKGTSIDGKVYAIPNMRNMGNIIGLNIDTDVAAEFGIEDGQHLTMEEIDTFLRAAHEKYPDRYAMVPQGGSTIVNSWSWDGLGDEKYIGVLTDCGQSTTVENLFETDDFVDFCHWTRSWYTDGLIMQDILSNSQSSQTMVNNKQAIAYFDNYHVNKVPGMIRTVIIDAWSQSNSYQALCYGININSKNKDAAFKALEILYTDAEVSTLLTDGIEGTHYIINDDGTMSFPEGKTAADCGYGMAEGDWIVPYAGNTLPRDVNGPTYFEDLKAFNASTLKTKGFGFVFDITNVTDQYTACSNVMDKYYTALMSGSVDVESTIAQANQELEEAGLADIIAEKQAQLVAFLGN